MLSSFIQWIYIEHKPRVRQHFHCPEHRNGKRQSLGYAFCVKEEPMSAINILFIAYSETSSSCLAVYKYALI